MKNVYLLFLLLPCFLNAQSKRALFLGNSYTNYNNLPQLTAILAGSAGDTLIVDSNTPGGYTLQSHSTNANSIGKIAQGSWDFVVLQEQSQRPSFPQWQVEADVFPYAKVLDSIINKENPCAETIFYMTWGRKNGDASNCANWPPVCTYEGMDSLLNLRYRMMADSNDAIISPVGATWNYIRANYPNIGLYSPDESHPSPEGSYAAACCFYTVIFRKDPTLITNDASIDSTEAAQIRMATKAVVFDSLSKWHVGEYDVFVEYNFLPSINVGVPFQSNTRNTSFIYWEILDSVYRVDSPIVYIPNDGDIPIRLVAGNECDTVVILDTIPIYRVSNQSPAESSWQIIPNPATNNISLKSAISGEFNFKIFGIHGSLIKQGMIRNEEKIDISSFSPGNYIIELSNQHQINSVLFRKD